MTKSAAEEALAFQLRHATNLHFEREYRFHPDRKWRADFRIGNLLVEVEGAIRGSPGRHQRLDGMTADCAKYAEAMCLGFTVLRVMPSQVRSGEALRWIERIIRREE